MEVSARIESTDILHNFLYGTSSVAALLVENINNTSLLEIQDKNSLSDSAFKNLSE